MSPAAGGDAPAQSAPAIAGTEPDRAAARRDPMGPTEGSDLTNAAARKPAWVVPAPDPAAGAVPRGGIIGGEDSWPALVESTRACPKSSSSDSIKSLPDGSVSSTKEDPIAPSVPLRPVVEVNLISNGSNPTSTPPTNAAVAASSEQNGATAQPNPVRPSESNGGNSGGSSRGNGIIGGRRSANSSDGDGSSSSGGDRNWSTRSLGSNNSLNDSIPAAGTSGTGNGFRNNNRNNIRGVDDTVSSNGNNGGGGSSNRGSNNNRNGSGTSNGIGGRGGYRSRRDHERGGNFSPRNNHRVSVMPYQQQQQQQQQPSVFQPASFHQPSMTPAANFIVPQHFVSYGPPYAYHGDAQPYPLYPPPMEQFQNMHLVQPQDQSNLHEDIRTQIEFYFSTNNLCRDTFLRRHMNHQGWVPINLILGFNRMRRFTGLVDTNYILDAIRGSEILEVQGTNVRRRNDWAYWVLH